MSGPMTITRAIECLSLFQGRPVDVTSLAGGAMNGVFLVRTGDQRFVVRVPGEGSELLGINRSFERTNAESAAALGVSPRIVEYLDDGEVMVMEFIDGRVPTTDELRSPEQVDRIAAALRRLHAGTRFDNDVDVFARTQRWLQVCSERAYPLPDGLEGQIGEVRQMAQLLAAGASPSVPCHNDLSAENLIDDGRQLWLIDFEFSGNNDPCYDLGSLAYEVGLDEDARVVLCEAYFGVATPMLLARMKLYGVLENVTWSVFCSIQARFLPDPSYWEGATSYWASAESVLDSDEFPRLMREAARI